MVSKIIEMVKTLRKSMKRNKKKYVDVSLSKTKLKYKACNFPWVEGEMGEEYTLSQSDLKVTPIPTYHCSRELSSRNPFPDLRHD